MEEQVECNPNGDYSTTKSVDSGQPATGSSNFTSAVVRRQKRTQLDEDEDERNLRRASYLRATKDRDSDPDDQEEPGDSKSGEILKPSHSIQKIFAVFTKMVETPLSPTSCSSKLDDFAKAESATSLPVQESQKEGWLELKINEKSEEKLWKNVYVVLRNNSLHFYKDKTTSRESPYTYEETQLNLSECKAETSNDYSKKRTILKLKTENGPDYLLQTESEFSMQSWLQIIDDITANNSRQLRWARRSITSRTRSPTSQSPVNKMRKASSEQFQHGGEKENRKSWKGKVSKQWKKMQGTTPEPMMTYPEGGSIGVPLEECPMCPDLSMDQIPYLVQVCCGIVEEKGLNSVGIYRVPGNSAAVMTLTEQVNKGGEHFKLDDPRWCDVNVVSSLLKSFLRKLPDPIFTLEMYSVFVEMSKIEDSWKRLNNLKQLVHELPDCNFETLKFVCMHLCKIIKNSDVNKMDLRNLAIVFGPTLVRTCDDNMLSMVTDMAQQCRIIESILSNSDWFFNPDDLKSNTDFQNVNEIETEECKRIVEVTPITEFSQAGYQSLLLTNLQKLEESDRASAKDIMSGILSAANRKMLRVSTGSNKFKKESVDSSNSPGSDMARSQLWLDLSESDTPGGTSPAPSPRPNLLGAGNLVAAVPQLMGTLVGAHHHSSASNLSSLKSDSHNLTADVSTHLSKETQRQNQARDYLSKSSNCLQTCSSMLDNFAALEKKERKDKTDHTEALDLELAGGILFQEPYPTEAYNKNLLMDNNTFCNQTYLNLSLIPSSEPIREVNDKVLNHEEDSCESCRLQTIAEHSNYSDSGSLLTELTATFDEKLRLLLDPNYQSSSSIQSESSSMTTSQSSCVQRRKSDLASSLTSLQMSPQQRSLSLDHSSVDCDLIREQLDALNLKQKIKKSDLKRGRLVDKLKEPLSRQRNNSASKPELKEVSQNPVLTNKLFFDCSKPVNRRHTICGSTSLNSLCNELYISELNFVENLKSLNPENEYSFAKSVHSMEDWRAKFRLRSSSPDLIWFSELQLSLPNANSLPVTFLTALL